MITKIKKHQQNGKGQKRMDNGQWTMDNGKTRLVSVAGKGGVGKTTITALIIDELARQGYPGPILAVDADPATTLHLALGLPNPAVTVADIRETTVFNAHTIRQLPAGLSRADYVQHKLEETGALSKYTLRKMPLHFMAIGQSEKAGCYCQINNALSQALENIRTAYPLVIIDNEAGLEHINRHRVRHIDLLLLITTVSYASISVAMKISHLIRHSGINLVQAETILNRVHIPRNAGAFNLCENREIAALVEDGKPVVKLTDRNTIRAALGPIVYHTKKTQCV